MAATKTSRTAPKTASKTAPKTDPKTAPKTTKQPAVRFCIAQDPAADEVLGSDPFAVVVGMMLDQQYGMEHAFRGAHKVLTRFGTLDPATIATADPEYFKSVCSTPPAIHRYPGSMSTRLQELAAHVAATYDGDVTRLWTEAETGQELFRRVQQLPGFGKQKAQIFVALLAKQLGVRPPGWEAVAGDYALPGHRSVADVTDAESLQKVREYKQEKKAAAKAAAPPAAPPAAR